MERLLKMENTAMLHETQLITLWQWRLEMMREINVITLLRLRKLTHHGDNDSQPY